MDMAGSSRWRFGKSIFDELPSSKDGIDKKKELFLRQQCAAFLQELGMRMHLSQLSINTSVIYMHRFYMFKSMKEYSIFEMGPVFAFLSSKIEEQVRHMKHIIACTDVSYILAEHKFDLNKDLSFREKQLINYERVLVQTLGFDFMVDHPHSLIINSMGTLKVEKTIIQSACFFASCCEHLTFLPVQSTNSFVAAVCILGACSWARHTLTEVDGKPWFHVFDPSIEENTLQIYTEYLVKIIETSPYKLKWSLASSQIYNKEGIITDPKPFHDRERMAFKIPNSSPKEFSSKSSQVSDDPVKKIGNSSQKLGKRKYESIDETKNAEKKIKKSKPNIVTLDLPPINGKNYDFF